METISLNIKDNINLEDVLRSVNNNVLSNLQFINQLKTVLLHMSRNYENAVIYYDENSFKVISSVSSNKDYKEDLLKDNISYEEASFNIDSNSNMIMESSSGTLFDFNKYYDTFKYADPSLNVLASNRPKNIVSLYHMYKVFDKDGIEVRNDFYSDNVPNNDDIDRYNVNNALNTLRNITTKYKPLFELTYKDDNFFRETYNPYYLSKERLEYNISLSDETLIYGNKDNVHRSVKIIETNSPDILRVNQVPFIDFDRNPVTVTSDYMRSYPDMSKQEIEKEIAIRFNNSLEESSTKRNREEIYKRLKERSDNELLTRYTENEESKGKAM